MPAVIDQTADINFQEFHRLSKLYPLPDWVKKANLDQAFAAESLPVTAYADPQRKQFPCHTKVATFISYMYFLEHRNEMPTKIANWVQDRFAKFISQHGLTNTANSLVEKHAELHTSDIDNLPDSAFAIVQVLDSGLKDRQYPLRSALEVKTAAEWLHTWRDEMPSSLRRAIASRVLEKAAQYGANLGDKALFLERQAGRGLGSPEKISQMIADRVKAADKVPAEVKDRMLKLAATVKAGGEFLRDPAAMAGVVDVVDDFDSRTGIKSGYGNVLKRPEDVVFEVAFKEASAFVAEACELTNGSVYETQQLEKLSYADVSALFGDEFADQVSIGMKVDGEKMATLARTLTRPDADLLDRLLSDNGMTPVVKNAAATRHRVSQQLLQLAADRYVPSVRDN